MLKFILALAIILAPNFVMAGEISVPTYVRAYIQSDIKSGTARFRVGFWDIYDATLYAPAEGFSANKPFALSLHYLRSLEGKAIAETSATEIKKQGFNDAARLAAWEKEMIKIFPDVSEGVILTGIYMPNGKTLFYKNGKKIGAITDQDFGYYFFNIWFGKNTRDPELRDKLLKDLKHES